MKNQIPTFDSKANKIMREENFIANGSTVRVNWSHGFYTQGGGGVSLYLNSVQVIELIEWEGGSASDYGFGVEEGYEEVKNDFENQDRPAEIEAKEEAAKMTPEEAQAETEIQEEDDLPF